MTSDITTSTTTSDIDRLVRASGPFASVYLPAPSAIDDAGDRLAVEWRNARRRLGNDGAPDALLDRIASVQG